MFHPSNLGLQEDLVFCGVTFFNVLETENEYPSGKDSAFSLSVGEMMEPEPFNVASISRSQSRAESRASDSVLPEWWLRRPHSVKQCY